MLPSKGESAQGYAADPRNDEVLVYVDGRLVPRDQASVSVSTAASSWVRCWEGMRLIDGAC